ncbi:DsbA family protein [Geodermatophilus ruber]|uniref:Protein-disulfide isomerase n=1 Tax=Geodermatophilus ruber TaxID=504800 RepID=A0A1I4K0Z9_9ACTN|nr:thioredoxin domain-containing protein [Geodermatophilus ruber]SFL72257.1 Protein-disulfide isomerase [Geodermatophilus ruber]
MHPGRGAGRSGHPAVRVAVAVAVLMVAVLTVIAVQSHGPARSDAAVPAGAVDGGTAFVAGSPRAPVTVDVYEDFQCPVCSRFEAETGGTLAVLAARGTAQVRYHPIAVLDRASTDRYSTRALNAAAVVADAAGTRAFLAFHDLAFAHQPAEGSRGLTDAQLTALAAQAGADGAAVTHGITHLRFAEWTRQVTDDASRAGVTSTPTVLVDGKALADRTAAGLAAAVAAATRS